MSDLSAIPFTDLKLQQGDLDAVADVLRSGSLGMGAVSEEFEAAFAEQLGVRHAVAVGSCTAALHLAYLAAGVGPGDEVIVPSFTFAATASAVLYCGATPVFADIVGLEDPGVDPEDVEAKITDRTKAVACVHFAGYPAAADRLEQLCADRGLALIEDSAHAPSATLGGRKLGTIGLAGAFSFFSNKILAVGEGGLLATDDDDVAALARSRRSHARDASGDVTALGYNYRWDEPRAALALSRLAGLEEDIQTRRRLVREYRSRLCGLDGLIVPYRDQDVDDSSCYVMPVMLADAERRDDLRTALREGQNAQTSILYPAIHEFSAYRGKYPAEGLERTELATRSEVTIPLYPHMTADEQERVISGIEEFLGVSRYPLSAPEVSEEDVQAVVACLDEGWLTMGPRTQALEAALADELGAASVACVSSGTAALQLSCRAVGLGPGDEVIVPALSFVAAAAAVRWTGGTPVFCDVASPQAPNVDVAAVEAAITDRTKAVVAVHLWGYPAPVAALRELCDERGLALIEDAADAVTADTGGASAGTVGHLGCLAFSPGKQLLVGEGGAVITADAEMEAKVRSLRSHAMTSVTWDRHRGYAQSYDVVDVGYNFRMDEPRAALGLSRLPRLARDISRRREVAAGYRERLAGVPGVELMWDDAAVQAGSNLVFPLLAADGAARDSARSRLQDAGIETSRHPALHTLTAYRDEARGPLPAAEDAADRHYCLPVSASLQDSDLDAIAEEVAKDG